MSSQPPLWSYISMKSMNPMVNSPSIMSAVRQTMGIMRPKRPMPCQTALTTRQMRRRMRYMTVFRHHLPHLTRVAKLSSSARTRPKAKQTTASKNNAACISIR